MGLRAYIIKRTINSFILLLFVLTINFAIFTLMPGNPIETLAASGRLRPGQIDQSLNYGALPVHFMKDLADTSSTCSPGISGTPSTLKPQLPTRWVDASKTP